MNLLSKLLLFSLLFCLQYTYAGEFTGQGVRAEDVLIQNHKDPNELVRTGHKIMTGELTGIGRNIPTGKVTIFVLEKEVVEVEDIRAVQVGNQTIQIGAVSDMEEINAPVSNVKVLRAQQRVIKAEQVKGLVFRARGN